MSAVFAGELSITVGTRKFAVKANVRKQALNSVKEEVVGLDGLHGYREVPAAAGITATFSATDTAGNQFFQSLQEFGRDGTGVVTITPISGAGTALSQQVLTSAAVVGQVEHMVDQGEFEVEFKGDQIRDA